MLTAIGSGCSFFSLGIVPVQDQFGWLVLTSAAPGQGEAKCSSGLELVDGLTLTCGVWVCLTWACLLSLVKGPYLSGEGLLACIGGGSCPFHE